MFHNDIKEFLFGAEDELLTEKLKLLTPGQDKLLQQGVDVTDPTTGEFSARNVPVSNFNLEEEPTALENLSLAGIEQAINGGTEADQAFQSAAAGTLLEQVGFSLNDVESFEPSVTATGELAKSPSTSQILQGAPSVSDSVRDTSQKFGPDQGSSALLSSKTGAFDTSKNIFDNNLLTSRTDDFFQRSIQEPLLDEFERVILPRISRNFSNDFFSSDRERADTRAQQELLRALSVEKGKVSLAAADQQFQQDKLSLGAKEGDLERLLDASEGDFGRLLESMLGDADRSVRAREADNSLLVDASASDRATLANAAANDAATEQAGFATRQDTLIRAAQTQQDAIQLVGDMDDLEFGQLLDSLDAFSLPRDILDAIAIFENANFDTEEDKRIARLRLMVDILNVNATENVVGVSDGGEGAGGSIAAALIGLIP